MENMEELMLDMDNADDMESLGNKESAGITDSTEFLDLNAECSEDDLIDEKDASLVRDNRGIGVVEIVLILVVLVALVIIFKDKIMEIINSAFESITGGASSL